MYRIVRLINAICDRPGIYLGSADVRLLQTYLLGYLAGLAEVHSIDEEVGIMDRFEQFVHSAYRTTEIADGKSWSSLIRERTDSEPGAFVEFHSLWRKFLQSQSA